MDATVTVEKSTRGEWIKTIKRTFTIWPVLKDEDKARYATGKNWRVFFVVIFTYWLYAIFLHTYLFPDQNTTTNVTSHLFFNETDNNIIDSSGGGKDNFKISHHEAHNETTSGMDNNKTAWNELVKLFVIIGKAYTCNISNLEEYNEKGKLFALGIHLLASLNLLLIAMEFIQYDKKMFTKQPSVFGAVFLFIAFIERLSILYNIRSPVETSWLLPSHEKLICWVIPEIILLIIWMSKMFSAVHNKDKHDFCDVKSNLLNDENDGNDSAIGSDDESIDEIAESSSDDEAVDVGSSTDSDNGSDTESVEEIADEGPNNRPVDQANVNNSSNDNSGTSSKDELAKIKYVYKIIPFHYYTYAFIFSFPFVIILKLLTTLTISVLHNANWHQSHSYVFAGSSIYIGLTIYHFELMLTACATNMLIDSEKFTLNDLYRSVYIVTRYHFGSACYRAMPIAPSCGQHAETVLKTFDWDSPTCRAFFKYSVKLSRTIIGARGCNNVESMKEVIRIVLSVPMQDYFYSFGSMAKFLFTFLLPINSLMIIFLRDRGIYDSHFAKASWVMYLTMVFTFYLAMKFFKTVSYTIGLRLCERQVNERERFGEV